MTTRPIRLSISLALVLVLIAVGSGSMLAAKGDKKADKEPVAEEPQEQRVVERVKGKKLKVAKAQVAKNWTRFNDPVGDQVTRDGTPAIDADPWTDLTQVNVVGANAAPKMLRVLGQDYPAGTARTYYGVDADWRSGQDAFYVIAKTDGKLPEDVEDRVQLIVTIDGDTAVPMQAAETLGPYAGADVFSISGHFGGGFWDSGTVSLEGWQRGEQMPFYNGPSRDMGYYDKKPGTFVHIARVPRDAMSATVTLRSAGAKGEIFDEVVLPSGGRFIGVEDATWGLDVADGATPLLCRSVQTLSAGSVGAEEIEPGSAVIRYSVAWEEGSDVGELVAELGGTVQLSLVEPGVEEPAPDASPAPDAEPEPMIVEATIDVAASGNAATFDAIVPEGQWLVTPVSADDLVTSSGQTLVDMRPLTGKAGVLTGEGLDGFVAGVEGCGA